MDDQTVVLTCDNRLGAVTTDGTSPREGGRRWLGDPLETVFIRERRVGQLRPGGSGEEDYVPRTELGRKLWEIRKRIVAAGRATMTWEDIEREVAERRGEVGGPYE